jgi:hypothetical protein
MTLQEFNKYAIEVLEEYGLNPDRIDVMAGVFNGKDIHYTIQCWDSKTKKHIRASQPNPSSTLVEFKDKLKAHFKDYSKEVKDIEL